uniref:Polycystic kidney disease 1 like 2b n=1 Tax=Gadus morhua TaxID=8049 RepID=A0A8C5BSP8_GADMO
MADAVFSVMLLMSFSLNAVSYAQDLTDISCPDSQEAFDGSCYELVALQRPFLNAESWCERGGGHLAFILNDETQQFLQKHLDPGKDWWLGLAPAAPNLTLDSTAGSLSWLDGSDISYNNWVTDPHADSACGHVLRNSGFQWEAKVNCSQDLNFICQFDSGRSIACDGLNATLQCGSGQVIEIDDSFYGRKTIHYCKSKETLSPASSKEDCSWIDVVDPVKGHCHGLQACQAIADVGTFGEPCPELGSYLSVEYHCKDGMIRKLAAVSDNVNITVKWLLHPFEGNLTCTLNAGDGHNIDSYTPEEVDSSVMHKYSKPGVFTVGVECTTSDWHVTAQRVITIQESVGEFGVITCYSQNLSTEGTACQALYGTTLQLHVVLEAGTNVNLEIQSRGTVVANFSSVEGAMGHNITVSAEVTEQLGPGCHDVTLHASNAVTPAGVSTELRLCLVEPVDGLKASAVAEEDACPLDTSDLALSVSLERGAPAELLFSLASPWDNRTETREMLNASLQDYHFSDPIRGKTDPGFAMYTFPILSVAPTAAPSTTTSQITSVAAPDPSPSCVISPLSGTVLDTFDISCKTSFPCTANNCLYCLKTKQEANITGTVGSVSLTKLDGTTIPVENLPNEIEVRPTHPLDINSHLNKIVYLFTTPSENISFKLLLGFGGYPSEEDHVAQIQMPLEGSPEEESYIWVLGPEERKGHVGLHYLVVKPIVGAGVTSINATVSVSSIAAQCKFWNDSTSAWSENGCRVGPLTTSLVTQCLCNHLTLFGSSFFVMPNMVDVSRTAELFATFTTNPVVVCFVGAIFVVYLLVAIWARRKDIQDLAKVKITVLDDNDPFAEYRYMLTVNTGHRRGASTSSQVAVTLQGEEGESEPHHLTDSEKPVFERGGMDMFLLTTPFSIGELQSIRVWHDNSGEHPAWYINKVMVQDLETGQKWHFLCNSWLSIDMGECTLDKVFPVATETDLKKFSNLFFMKTAKDFRDGHIWFSVISRPPCSTFTRVQRVSCCFSLLLCTMLTSIMFWGIPTDPSEQTMDLGHIEFTWQQVMIGFQSSIIMFPINVLIVSIFRNTRPRQRTAQTDASKQGNNVFEKSYCFAVCATLTLTLFLSSFQDIKRIAQSLSKAMKSPLPALELRSGQPADINTLLSLVEDIIRKQNRVGGEFYSDASKKEASMILTLGAVNLQETNLCGSPEKTADGVQKMSSNSQYLYRQLRHVEKELCLLGASRFPDPGGYSRAVQQVQGMKGLLEYHLPSSSQPPCPSSPEESLHGDGGAKGKCCQGGLPWWFVFVGWTLVVATSGVSGYFTMMYGLTYGKDRSISWLISMVVSFVESLFITQPLKVLGFAAFFALVLKKVDQEEYGEPQVEDTRRTSGMFSVKTRVSRRDSNCSFYQPPPPTDIERMKSNMIKEQKVYALIKEILAYAGFMWMLLLVAYGQRDPNAYFLSRHIQRSFSQGISDTMSIGDVFVWANTSLLKNIFGSHAGFITDGNSKLVGNARLRQVRVQNNTCQIDKSMRSGVPDCHAPYSWDVEDMGSYGPSWGPSGSDNASEGLSSPWKYQSQARLKALPLWGSVRLYRGGGFVVDLVASIQNSTRTLGYLFDNTWLDVYTQALFVEFTVYNANVNLFCLVTLMLETTGIGKSHLQTIRLYQSAGGLHIFVMASEAIYFLFIFYYMVIQGKLMKQHSWAYFRNKWNLLELAIILLSWSALSVFIKRTLLGNRDMSYYQTHKNQFPSFHETATADAVLGYLIAFLVLLATIKLWHLMRLNPKLHMITATLQRAWTDISGFLVVITIMFLAYSIASNLLYGWKMYSYRTLLDSALTMVSLQLGIFNYDEVLNYNPLLGGFLIGSCIVFMTFVVLNLFISVILECFSSSLTIVDLMLMKLCSLFGIKFKTKGGPSQDTVVSSSSKNGVSMISSIV